MSAAELRQAAATLRERANAATQGPWTETVKAKRYGGLVAPNAPADADEREGYGGALIAETVTSLNRTYIATMHPAVGLALADWLDAMAAVSDGGGKYVFGSTEDRALSAMDDVPLEPTSLLGRAHTLARLINGDAS